MNTMASPISHAAKLVAQIDLNDANNTNSTKDIKKYHSLFYIYFLQCDGRVGIGSFSLLLPI
jgi:hypothetical protein